MKNTIITTNKSERKFLKFEELVFDVANRKINQRVVKQLKESVAKHGVQRIVLVVKLGGKNIIVDGQHLAVAIHESSGELIECSISKCANHQEKVELMRDFNRNANKWKLSDFINSNFALGKSNYKKLVSIITEHKAISKANKSLRIQECLLYAIFAGKNRNTAKNDIEAGTFTIPNYSKSVLLCQQIYELQKVGFPYNSRIANEVLINLITEEGENYNHSLFLNKIREISVLAKIDYSNNEAIVKDTIKKQYESAIQLKKVA